MPLISLYANFKLVREKLRRVKLPRFQSFLNILYALLYFISSIILNDSACNDENLIKIGLYQVRSGDFPKNATDVNLTCAVTLRLFY